MKQTVTLYVVLTNGVIGMPDDIYETRQQALRAAKYLNRSFNSESARRALARDMGLKKKLGPKVKFTVVKMVPEHKNK